MITNSVRPSRPSGTTCLAQRYSSNLVSINCSRRYALASVVSTWRTMMPPLPTCLCTRPSVPHQPSKWCGRTDGNGPRKTSGLIERRLGCVPGCAKRCHQGIWRRRTGGTHLCLCVHRSVLLLGSCHTRYRHQERECVFTKSAGTQTTPAASISTTATSAVSARLPTWARCPRVQRFVHVCDTGTASRSLRGCWSS